MIKISIVIPTFDRNEQLEQALVSCARQRGMAPDEYEIVVVDNSRDDRARPVVERFAGQCPVPVRYFSERRPGISHARNAGVAAARGELVAFLDDDGEADADWLGALWSTYRRYDADVIFGALLPRLHGDISGWERFFNDYFTRRIGPTGTAPKKLHGTNNSCVRRAVFPPHEPFPLQLGLLGGGDIALFRKLQGASCRFIYCAEAIIFDHIPVERVSYRYLLKRRFWQGQVTTYMHTLPGMQNPKLLVRSLAAGLVGLIQHSGVALGQLMLGRRQEAALASLKIAWSCGRLMWMQPFRKQRYGIVSPPPKAPLVAEAGQ